MRILSRTVEIIYFCISIFVALSVLILARPIGLYWFNTTNIPSIVITTSVILTGFSIAFQLPGSLYQGGILGLQRHLVSNVLVITTGIFRQVGALLVLKYFSPTVLAFFLWVVLSDFLSLIVSRKIYWNLLPQCSI